MLTGGCGVAQVEDKGLFTVDRTPKSNHAVITIRDRAMAQRLVVFPVFCARPLSSRFLKETMARRVQNYCKSRPLKIRNHLLRVDIQVASSLAAALFTRRSCLVLSCRVVSCLGSANKTLVSRGCSTSDAR